LLVVLLICQGLVAEQGNTCLHASAQLSILLLLCRCHPSGAKASLKVPTFLSERSKASPEEPAISSLVQLALMRLHWKAVPLLVQAGAPWPDSFTAAPHWDQEHGWEGLEVRLGWAAVPGGVQIAWAADWGDVGLLALACLCRRVAVRTGYSPNVLA
jgi:hypothetical protein